MHGPEAPEARPSGVECQIRIDEKPRHPVADEEAEHDPDHRKNDAGLTWVVVVPVEAVITGFGGIISGKDAKNSEKPRMCPEHAVWADRIVAPRDSKPQAAY